LVFYQIKQPQKQPLAQKEPTPNWQKRDKKEPTPNYPKKGEQK